MKKDIAKLIQAIAVKQNLNDLKKFAYEQGYKNQVDSKKDALIDEVLELGLKDQAVIDYLREKYTGGVMLKSSGKSRLDALTSDDE